MYHRKYLQKIQYENTLKKALTNKQTDTNKLKSERPNKINFVIIVIIDVMVVARIEIVNSTIRQKYVWIDKYHIFFYDYISMAR